MKLKKEKFKHKTSYFDKLFEHTFFSYENIENETQKPKSFKKIKQVVKC